MKAKLEYGDCIKKGGGRIKKTKELWSSLEEFPELQRVAKLYNYTDGYIIMIVLESRLKVGYKGVYCLVFRRLLRISESNTKGYIIIYNPRIGTTMGYIGDT